MKIEGDDVWIWDAVLHKPVFDACFYFVTDAFIITDIGIRINIGAAIIIKIAPDGEYCTVRGCALVREVFTEVGVDGRIAIVSYTEDIGILDEIDSGAIERDEVGVDLIIDLISEFRIIDVNNEGGASDFIIFVKSVFDSVLADD